MMNYILIDPVQKRHQLASCKSLAEAQHVVQLKAGDGGLDHGTIWRSDVRGLSIVVDGFSLFGDPDELGLFSLDGRLYAGKAVCYATDAIGKTVSAVMSDLPPLTWYRNARAAKLAFSRGELALPRIQLGDEILWEWPQPGGREAVEKAAKLSAQALFDQMHDAIEGRLGDIVVIKL